MIITLAGQGGSGKSTVAKLLAQKLEYRRFSGGDFRGEIAMKHGLTIDELNEIGKREIWTDKECDDLVAAMGKKEDNLVIDGWMAWHFIPHSFKVYLTVDPYVGAKRVFAHQRPDETRQDTVEGMQTMLSIRFFNNVDRYKQWYAVDFTDENNYDLVIDTTNLSPEQVAAKILHAIHSPQPAPHR